MREAVSVDGLSHFKLCEMSASGTLEGAVDIEDAYRSINFGRLKIAVFANDPTAKFDSRQFYRLARYPRQCVGHHGNYN